MGIAASQARYLYLTARQTNVEFEGQQLNQARTNLANEQAGIFNKMLELEAPVVPTLYEIKAEIEAWGTEGPKPEDYPGGTSSAKYKEDYSMWLAATNDGKNVDNPDANAAYEYAVSQYNVEKIEYEEYLDELNAQSEEIHQRDQVLELQLRQLDTEQQTIVTELESVKKVIDKNIEIVFKTFQS